MKKKQIIIGSAIISAATTVILAIFFATFLKRELGEDVKYAYYTLIASFPVLFLIFIPIIKVSDKAGRENRVKMETIKGIIGEMKASKNHNELVSLQTEFAKNCLDYWTTGSLAPTVIGALNTAMPFLFNKIPEVFDENILCNIDKNSSGPEITARNEYMAKTLSMLLSFFKHDKSKAIVIGRAAYTFGGYDFMKQVLAHHLDFYKNTTPSQRVYEIASSSMSEAWNEIEDWEHNKK